MGVRPADDGPPPVRGSASVTSGTLARSSGCVRYRSISRVTIPYCAPVYGSISWLAVPAFPDIARLIELATAVGGRPKSAALSLSIHTGNDRYCSRGLIAKSGAPLVIVHRP